MVQHNEAIIKRTISLISNANEKGLILRVLGAIAFRIHCTKYGHLLKRARVITDIDLMGYSKQVDRLEKYIIENGFEMRPPSFAMVTNRRIFHDEKSGITVDLFLDKLEMCHNIDFRGRLEIDYPTIPLAEMLLEKLQIVEINEKDVKDAIILLYEHDLGDSDTETINIKHIAGILSHDWGFYYTATTNLRKIRALLGSLASPLGVDEEPIRSKIDRLLDTIEKEPKSLNWKLRAKVGTKKIWYKRVEEIADI
jgi:hypothetical protein